MSASDSLSAIYLTDSPKQIKTKINKYAFSGGKATIEEHRKYGGDPEVDMSYRYLEFFLEEDEEVKQLAESYRDGSLLSGEMKARAIKCIQEVVSKHQERKANLTAQVLAAVSCPRSLL